MTPAAEPEPTQYETDPTPHTPEPTHHRTEPTHYATGPAAKTPDPTAHTRAVPVPRLIATDLDGTLLRDDKTVSQRTIDALAAADAAGIEVFFVTGRPVRWMNVVSGHLAGHGLAIVANGAAVYDLRAGELVEAFPLPESDALAFASALRDAVPGTSFAVERTEAFRREPEYEAIEPDLAWPPAPLEELLASQRDQPLLKLLAKHPSLDPDDFLATAVPLAGRGCEVTRSAESALLEVSGAGVSKASTLAKCCAGRGVTAAEVVAFGDMPNDLGMLEWAGTSYAVANAHPRVLAAAGHRTRSNQDDGVAQVIERLVADRLG